MWIALAFASAFFAGIGAVLSKAAKDGIDPDAASAVRFTVIFILAWISPIVTGSVRSLTEIGAVDFLYLIHSGIAMGGSWLCYFKALSLGDVNRVVPVDKSSVVLSILLALAMVFCSGLAFSASAEDAPKLKFNDGKFKIMHLTDTQDVYPASKTMLSFISYVPASTVITAASVSELIAFTASKSSFSFFTM